MHRDVSDGSPDLLLIGGDKMKTKLLAAGLAVFMTFAWYGHLKNLADRPWFIAALCSWGIAFFEYCLFVNAL